MKAGTATKLVLNMLSTGVMVRTGATFGNLMVNVRPTNAKLVDRAQRIIAEAVGCDLGAAANLLEDAGSVKVAIVMRRLGASSQEHSAREAPRTDRRSIQPPESGRGAYQLTAPYAAERRDSYEHLPWSS